MNQDVFNISDRKPSTYQASVRRRLQERLREVKEHEFISYQELNDLAGENVQGKARGVLLAARRALEKDGIVFGVVKDTGLTRLDSHQVVAAEESTQEHHHRTAGRSMIRLSAGVDRTKLSPQERATCDLRLHSEGIIRLITSAKTQKRLQERMQAKQIEPPNLLEALREMSNGKS